MSDLIDKQVYVLNECFKYKFRDSPWGVTQAHEKCAMKMKERKKKKKRRAPKIFFDGRKEVIRHVQKTRVMDIK